MQGGRKGPAGGDVRAVIRRRRAPSWSENVLIGLSHLHFAGFQIRVGGTWHVGSQGSLLLFILGLPLPLAASRTFHLALVLWNCMSTFLAKWVSPCLPTWAGGAPSARAWAHREGLLLRADWSPSCPGPPTSGSGPPHPLLGQNPACFLLPSRSFGGQARAEALGP